MADIIHSIAIDAPAERVHPLVSSANGLSEWWAADVTEPGGGIVELGFFNRGTIYTLQPVRIAVPFEAEWLCKSGKEWAGTKLIFKIQKNGEKSVVHFTHADWVAETPYFISCNTTWGGLMFRLRAAAEGKSQGPLFLKNGLGY
jgi:uncharacterized protein YndB with AHSA1/START domain